MEDVLGAWSRGVAAAAATASTWALCCLRYLRAASAPQTPPTVPTARSGSQQRAQAPALWQFPRSRSAAALLPRSPGCRPEAQRCRQGRQEEGGRCCRSTGRPPATGTPFSWDRLVQTGDAKGTSYLCLCFCPALVMGRGARGWGTPQLGPGLSSGCKRGRAGSWLSPKVAILTRTFSFACSSAWEQGSHLSTVSLTSEPKHPQGPHRTPPIH